MGDMLQQKTISIDYLSHTRVKNKNHAPTYYTENSHEAMSMGMLLNLHNALEKMTRLELVKT